MTQRLGGLMLAAGGAVTLVVNAVLTPMLPVGGSATELTGSPVFLWRLSLAAAGVFLLLGGMVGLHVRHAGRVGPFGTIAFGLAFLGTAMLFAHEWGQVFFVHQLALLDPPALEALDDSAAVKAEAIAAASVFMLGWVLLSISMLLARSVARLGPALVIAGFVAIPVLGSTVPGLWGQIAGNVVLSSGWIVLGVCLFRPPATVSPAAR